VALSAKTEQKHPPRLPAIWRVLWLGAALAGAALLAVLAWTARRGVPNWPAADGALIEIYTIHATRGEQVLGAYSQYGWFHPGPLLFYLLAPFYTVGGRTVYGLDLGAFVINVLSLVIIASIVGRRRSLSPVTAVSLLAGLSAYLARLPDLLTSAWNPHISVWPFAALIACTAALPYAGQPAHWYSPRGRSSLRLSRSRRF